LPGFRSFQRCDRILHAADFGRVFAQPARSSGAFFVLLARPNGLNFPRLGLAVSKKNIKTAVQRNRIKRLIRESFRQRKTTLGGCDYVALARQPAGRATNGELLEALGKHWLELTSCA
jgi:ribonuclease P protein component